VRQPYATLFAGWEDHWALGRYLQGDVPNWDGIMASSKLDALSSGEITLLWIGLAFWNGDRTATVADLVKVLDRPNRMRVAAALTQ
jgi:hypothetical protein